MYYTGSAFRGIPPSLQNEHIYVFPHSTGYDGQVYHYLAHDPFFRHGYATYLDEPRYRGRRVLVPGLAFLLAFGRPDLIDRAYVAVIWLFTGLGAYLLGRFAQLRGYPPWLGLGFPLVPSVLVSMDRLTVDVALAACCVGFALYTAEDAPVKLYAVLVAASLSRETGLLLPAAYCIFLLFDRQWKQVLIFATSTFPVAAWYVYLDLHTPPDTRGFLSFAPFAGIIRRLLNPFPYPFTGLIRNAAIALDLLALVGILAAVAWATYRAFRRSPNPRHHRALPLRAARHCSR